MKRNREHEDNFKITKTTSVKFKCRYLKKLKNRKMLIKSRNLIGVGVRWFKYGSRAKFGPWSSFFVDHKIYIWPVYQKRYPPLVFNFLYLNA